ncbi:Endonuclease/exonuclease/phosphatase [Parasponia andersonii]|uniref:Endonuclease/exonuclease/phosphatase n=1 Tax=Parasponia andersonii TaxID=3476 RepID=A0A2P5AKC7_PARAD|nr:Endonuclease/exonuclease/phosphatase [Parasponia andersonii]
MSAKSSSGVATIPIGSNSSTPKDPINDAGIQFYNGASSNGLIFAAHVLSCLITIQQNKTPLHENLDVHRPHEGIEPARISGDCGAVPPVIMGIVSWNSRGLGSPRAFHRLRRLLQRHTPRFSSQRLSCGEKKKKKVKQFVGFDNSFHTDCVGRSNGPIMLWRKNWDVSIQNYSWRFYIDMVIKSENDFSWHFRGIYSELPVIRLGRLNAHLNIPCVCRGDFNEFLYLNEKKRCLDPGNRNDNRREEEANIQEWLGRFVANEEWCAHFVNRRVFHHDDHRVLCLVLDSYQLELSNGIQQKRFAFKTFCVGDNECKEVIMVARPILN